MKIVITCNMGASTSILQMKLQEESDKRGYNIEFDAVPFTQIDKEINSIDILLCSPQIRFAYEELCGKMGEKPCLQLSVQDFGLMNAPKIMDQVEPYLK